MALVLTIDAIDRTSVLVDDRLVVEQQAANFISICSLVLLDVAGNITITAEDDISVVDGATTFFAGRVVDVRYTLFTTQSRHIHIKCQDKNAQLGEVIIDTEEVFTAEDDAVIIDSLFDDYLPAVDSETFVATIQDPLTITMGPCSLRSALNQISTQTGGYYYVDVDNALHYFSAEADGVAWWLSDDPDQVDSFSYFDTGIDKTSLAVTRLDGVYVSGAGIGGWRGTHGVGDRQAIVYDNRITTEAGVNNRGDAILNKYGDARETYTVSTYKAGLRAGMDVRFICAIYGVDDTFTVRKMIVKWDKAQVAYYTLILGDDVNPSLINERLWIEVLPQAVGPISAPRLPTSSRGWSHDIVFSVTDSDTVEWAAAGVITLADGSAYTMDAGNTGNMAAITYIYLDLDTSETVLQTTGAAATAVGSNKLLIAVAEDVADAAKDAIFHVFGNIGTGVMITADSIVASTITGNEINANSIAAGHIIAGAIETDKLDALAVTAAKIAAGTITADKIDMGLGDALFNNADGLLLLGPHCEISPTEWWSLRKQKATLSGAFHQEAGRWLGTRGLVIEQAVTNLCTNPSLETNATKWSDYSGGVGSRSADYAKFGGYSYKCVTPGVDAHEGVDYLDTANPDAATPYTASAWVLAPAGATMRFGFDDGPTTNVITFYGTGYWQRVVLTFTTHAAPTQHQVIVRTYSVIQAITFYVDGVQIEKTSYATSYCDGTLGAGYAWTGAAHGSTSTRAVTEVNLDAHAQLLYDNVAWSVALWVQMPFDYDAWPADGYFFSLYEDGNNFASLWLETSNSRISLRYKETAAVTINYPLAFSAGDWVHLVANIDTAGNMELFVNGVLGSTGDISARAVIQPTQMNLGALQSGASSQAIHDELAIFDRILTAIEVAGLYALQRPLVDIGSLDKPGIYLLDGRFKIASSTSGNRIEITADELAGYDSGGTKQFYLSAADGTAYAGAGKVVLDVTGLYMVGAGVTGDTRRLRFLYDDAGSIHEMGRVFGDWGGAGPGYTWLQTLRGAGDPWNGAVVVLAAIDTVAVTDVRITVKSDGNVNISGTLLGIDGDVEIDGGQIELKAATGNNVLKIPDDLADGFHIVDTGDGNDYITIETANDSREVVINQDEFPDLDFRVAANGVTDAFFVQGSDGNTMLGGVLSVGEFVGADPPGRDGSIIYRTDIDELKVKVDGAWVTINTI